MKKHLAIVLGLILGAVTASAKTIPADDKGPWSTVWQHCFAEEAQDFLRSQAIDEIDTKAYSNRVGLDYSYRSGKYIAELQNSKGHKVTIYFTGNYRTKSSNFRCYVDTERYSDTVVAEVVDSQTGKVYLKLYGTQTRPLLKDRY